jgi:hypothetical protein
MSVLPPASVQCPPTGQKRTLRHLFDHFVGTVVTLKLEQELGNLGLLAGVDLGTPGRGPYP